MSEQFQFIQIEHGFVNLNQVTRIRHYPAHDAMAHIPARPETIEIYLANQPLALKVEGDHAAMLFDYFEAVSVPVIVPKKEE